MASDSRPDCPEGRRSRRDHASVLTQTPVFSRKTRVQSKEVGVMITDLATQPCRGFHDLLSPRPIRAGGGASADSTPRTDCRLGRSILSYQILG